MLAESCPGSVLLPDHILLKANQGRWPRLPTVRIKRALPLACRVMKAHPQARNCTVKTLLALEANCQVLNSADIWPQSHQQLTRAESRQWCLALVDRSAAESPPAASLIGWHPIHCFRTPGRMYSVLRHNLAGILLD